MNASDSESSWNTVAWLAAFAVVFVLIASLGVVGLWLVLWGLR